MTKTNQCEAGESRWPVLRTLYGCPCVPLRDARDAMDMMQRIVSAGVGGYTVAVNAEKILLYRKSSEMRSLMEQSILCFPDGIGAVLALKWLHGRVAQRINMPVVALEAAQRYGWRTFILGATEDCNQKAVEVIRQRYPQLDIVGRLNGFESDERKLGSVRDSGAQLTLVALGSPKQELLSAELVKRVPGILAIGCGGALDILSGKRRRAPPFFVDHGLEWLYRLINEPRRARRQLVLPVFLAALGASAARVRLFGAGTRA